MSLVPGKMPCNLDSEEMGRGVGYLAGAKFIQVIDRTKKQDGPLMIGERVCSSVRNTAAEMGMLGETHSECMTEWSWTDWMLKRDGNRSEKKE